MDTTMATATQRDQVGRGVVTALFPVHDVMHDQINAGRAPLASMTVALEDLRANQLPFGCVQSRFLFPLSVRPQRRSGAYLAAVLPLSLHATPRDERLAARQARQRHASVLVKAGAGAKQSTICPFVTSGHVEQERVPAVRARAGFESRSAFGVAVIPAGVRAGVVATRVTAATTALIAMPVAHLSATFKRVKVLDFTAQRAPLGHRVARGSYIGKAVTSSAS
jgi:hypothetical protein